MVSDRTIMISEQYPFDL